MKKKLALVMAVLLMAAIGWGAWVTVSKISVKKNANMRLQTVPGFQLTSLDSSSYELKVEQPLVVIYFHSECNYCQKEAAEIKRNLMKFNEASILMVSSENLQKIRAFSKTYKLDNTPKVLFAKMDAEKVFENFGSTTAPQIYIYNKQGKLVREFKGETEIDFILEHL